MYLNNFCEYINILYTNAEYFFHNVGMGKNNINQVFLANCIFAINLQDSAKNESTCL